MNVSSLSLQVCQLPSSHYNYNFKVKLIDCQQKKINKSPVALLRRSTNPAQPIYRKILREVHRNRCPMDSQVYGLSHWRIQCNVVKCVRFHASSGHQDRQSRTRNHDRKYFTK